MLNGFDKACAVAAWLVGAVLLLLGVIGAFTGCHLDFTLPPILGVLPAFVGWGIVRSVRAAWSAKPPDRAASSPVTAAPPNPYAPTREDIERASPPPPEEPIDDELDRRFGRGG